MVPLQSLIFSCRLEYFQTNFYVKFTPKLAWESRLIENATNFLLTPKLEAFLSSKPKETAGACIFSLYYLLTHTILSPNPSPTESLCETGGVYATHLAHGNCSTDPFIQAYSERAAISGLASRVKGCLLLPGMGLSVHSVEGRLCPVCSTPAAAWRPLRTSPSPGNTQLSSKNAKKSTNVANVKI